MQWHKPYSHQAPFSKLKSGSTQTCQFILMLSQLLLLADLCGSIFVRTMEKYVVAKGILPPQKKISLQKMESLSGLNTLIGIFLAHVTQYYKSYKQN